MLRYECFVFNSAKNPRKAAFRNYDFFPPSNNALAAQLIKL